MFVNTNEQISNIPDNVFVIAKENFTPYFLNYFKNLKFFSSW
jgi:hypothetical protein